MENRWHAKSPSDIFSVLHSSDHGLSKKEAAQRLKEAGLNKLPEAKIDSLFVIFLRQFRSPLIYVLFGAGLVVFFINEIIDGSIIIFVLIFNAIIGTIQEGRAQNTLLALKKFVETKAVVFRDGKEVIISDDKVVLGDIVLLHEGERIPADARIIVANELKIDEAILTGESEPVSKFVKTLKDADMLITEQENMVFKGTHVVSGNGRVVVVAIGLNTVIGKISKEIATIDTEIPLKANIRHLSRLIVGIVVIMNATLFFLGIALDKPIREMFATVISLSVSLIPEGLPIVMTLVLASGIWRMSKKNALVKRLQAVEALGQVRIIAVDKTGTITKNEMMVQRVYLNDKFFEVGGSGYEPKGDIQLENNIIDPLNHSELLFVGKSAAFCANAKVVFSEETKEWRVGGDPTEAALLVFAEKIGFNKEYLEKESPQIAEIPFSYKTKYHATVHKVDNQGLMVVTGAPEIILELSVLSDEERKKLDSIFLKMSEDGLRVLALAVSQNAPNPLVPKEIKLLTFLAFLGMKDAIRPEAPKAIEKTIKAGIRVVMVTGDHMITARVVAKEAGIYQEGDEILTGQEIDLLSDKEFSKKLSKVSVFARVTPEHKLKIIQAYKSKGELIAMTGDGVNDATSLVAADLGISMGKIGTEVAKEAADIILLDDNFNSIVLAIEEGRSIYKTIKKVILYLFSTSVGEVLTIIAALFLGLPLPLLAAQIIWLNLVTDGFLDVALAMEPKESGLLRGSFEKPKKYFVDTLMSQRILVMSVPMMVGTLFLFQKYLDTNHVKAWTIALTTLAVFQWFNAWNCRSENKSIFQMNPFSNKFLVGATFIVIFLQLMAVYHPLMQKILRTSPLLLSEWLTIIVVATSIILVEEIRKFLHRRAHGLVA